MNKYWTAIICTILICVTSLISVYYVVDKNKYEFYSYSDDGLVRVNKQNNDVWRLYVKKGWVKIEQEQ